MLKRNLIANYLGQGWVALMGLVFIPLYIKFLGIEAFGLIGLFAVLVTWLTLLDMGLTPALSREMARFMAGSHSAESIRDLLRSIEFIALGMALMIVVLAALSANWLAGSWLQAETLPVSVVAQAFAIMGLVTALRLVESVYRSSIIGLQRQVLFNVINSVMATIRGAGAVAVLAWVSPTIQAFFLWQGLVSVATLIALAIATYSTLPKPNRGARFSVSSVRAVWRFAGGMLGITFLALLLTQSDKILLSTLLSLSDYGYYTVAALVAGALYMLVTPITQAWYPRLCELQARSDQQGLVRAYHQGAQLVTILAGSAAMILIVFAETLLYLWTRDHSLAIRVAPLLSVLAFGNLLNAFMWIPYQTQLAHGWTSLTLRINLVAVLIIVPAILWATPRYGPIGAAWVWVMLNIGYIFVGIHLMYQKILMREKLRWYVNDICLPAAAASGAALLVKALWPYSSSTSSHLGLLTVAILATLFSAVIASDTVRKRLLR